MDTAVFENHESEIRGYCRHYPTVFASASGPDRSTRTAAYLDFFAGASAELDTTIPR